MTVVLDSGAIQSIEGREQPIIDFLTAVRRSRFPILVPATAIAETWREPPSALLAKFLKTVLSIPVLDIDTAKRVGARLTPKSAASLGVVDAHIAEIAISRRPSTIVTSDPRHMSIFLENADISYVIDRNPNARTAVVILTVSNLGTV